MARPLLPVAGPKRQARAAPNAPIIPLAGALAAMPFAPLSPGLTQPPPTLSRPRAVVTPTVPVGKQPLKVKPPLLKQLKPGLR